MLTESNNSSQLETYAPFLAISLGILSLIDLMVSSMFTISSGLFGASSFETLNLIRQITFCLMNIAAPLLIYVLLSKLKNEWQGPFGIWSLGYIMIIANFFYLGTNVYNFFEPVYQMEWWNTYSKYITLALNISAIVFYFSIIFNSLVNRLFKTAFIIIQFASLIWLTISIFPFLNYEWYRDDELRWFWDFLFSVSGAITASGYIFLFNAFYSEQLKDKMELV